MQSRGQRRLPVKKRFDRQLWTCTRSLHVQTQLDSAAKQPTSLYDPNKSTHENQISAIDASRKETEETNEITELISLDNMDTRVEIFAGENMREYQGVLSLNGEQYVEQKHLLKQGALVETRR